MNHNNNNRYIMKIRIIKIIRIISKNKSIKKETWATAFQVNFASIWWQSGHIWCYTTNSTIKLCCNIVPFNSSFWIVNLILMRLECGSVHTKPASINRTLLRPLMRFKHNASNWRDSKFAVTHIAGGCKYLPFYYYFGIFGF